MASRTKISEKEQKKLIEKLTLQQIVEMLMKQHKDKHGDPMQNLLQGKDAAKIKGLEKFAPQPRAPQKLPPETLQPEKPMFKGPPPQQPLPQPLPPVNPKKKSKIAKLLKSGGTMKLLKNMIG